MKKYLVVPILLVSGLALAGGSSGGTGTLMLDGMEIPRVMQLDLGLVRVEIPVDDFRRAQARLAVDGEKEVLVRGVIVKRKDGGLVNVEETHQLVPARVE